MEPILGQLMLFGGNFPPRGWAFCEGQLLPISSNSALFSILGTTYGGDGRTTFALPDLRGRAPIHHDQGPGLSNYRIGQKAGQENVTLTVANLPNHNHNVTIQTGDLDPGTSSSPTSGMVPAEASEDIYGAGTAPVTTVATTDNVGGNQSFSNIQPVLAMSWCIALVGIYPSRS